MAALRTHLMFKQVNQTSNTNDIYLPQSEANKNNLKKKIVQILIVEV